VKMTTMVEYEGFPIKEGEKPMFYKPKEGCHLCHKKVNNCLLFRHKLLSNGSVLDFQPPEEVMLAPIYLVCYCCAYEREAPELKNYCVVGYSEVPNPHYQPQAN
jgi:hypothetical protein